MSGPRLATNPFPGLRPFRQDEEHLFFGRESQVDAMVDKLARSRFLAVVGTSGSGKSSLVNCGLRPALHRGLMAAAGTSWRMVQFRPGGNPIRSLARSLAAKGALFPEDLAGGAELVDIVEATLRLSKLGLADIYQQAGLGERVNLLVVADQFEELIRYRKTAAARGEGETRRSEEAAVFVNLLLEPRGQTEIPIYVVVTMRSDFLGDCAQFPGLPEAINEGQYLVPRMTRDERRAAIEGPVAVGGARIDPALLTRLVNDVGDNPDQLSILQHALNRTWARCQADAAGGPLSLPHYEAVGTMARALDQHAEKAYGELRTRRQEQICETMFKALTDQGTDARGIRRPTTLATLCALTRASQGEVVEVIDVFRKPSRSFLMPPLPEVLEPETVIDISHESLMRVWERLKGWAAEEAQSAQLYRRLSETAALHARGKAELWRNADLQVALAWREAENPITAWANLYGASLDEALAFLSESEAAWEREVRQIEERQRRELEQAQALAAEKARSARLFRLGFAVAAILAVAAAGAAYWAIQSQAIAIHQRDQAHLATERAEKATIAAKSSESAAKLAMSALEKSKAEVESQKLLAQNERNRAVEQYRIATSGKLATGALLNKNERPDLAALLSVQAFRAADTFEARNALLSTLQTRPELLATLPAAVKTLRVAFSPDGRTLAAAYENNDLWCWDIERGAPVRILKDLASATNSVAFSPDGRILAAGDQRGVVRLWNPATGEHLGELLPKRAGKAVWSVAFTPDGRTLATASEVIRLWNIEDRRLLGELNGHTAPVYSVAFSPDGSKLASGGEEGNLIVWDVASRARVGDPLKGQRGRVISLVFANGGQVLAASAMTHLMLWNLAPTPTLSKSWEAHEGEIMSLVIDKAGTFLASRDSRQLKFWSLPGGEARRPPVELVGSSPYITGIAISPDGKLVATTGDAVRLWSLSHRLAAGEPLSGSDPVRSMAFSPDGKTLAAGGRVVQVWDVEKRQALGPPLHAKGSPVTGVAFSRDGRALAATGGDAARVWDTTSRNPLDDLVNPGKNPVTRVAFSRTLLAVATGSDAKVQLWDLATHRSYGHLDAGGFVWSLTFSPDGTTLAAAASGRGIRLWEVSTRKVLSDLQREILTNRFRTQIRGMADVRNVEFSPHGRVLAAAGSGVQFWNVQRREKVGEPLPATGENLAFSPDGTMLAVGGRLWDVESRRPLGEPLGDWHSPAFSPDGRLLASASAGTIWFWDVNLDSWKRRACRLAGRNLSLAEWREHVGENVPYERTCEALPNGEGVGR